MTYEEYVELRNAKGVNDSEVARQTGMNRATLSDWKTGRSKPKQDKIERLEAYLGAYNKMTGNVKETPLPLYKHNDGIIDVESQIFLRNEILHRLLLAGGRVYEDDPKFVESILYTLEKMGEKK